MVPGQPLRGKSVNPLLTRPSSWPTRSSPAALPSRENENWSPCSLPMWPVLRPCPRNLIPKESYEVLAYHYDRSEDAQKAYEYLRLSGEKAIRTHFLWEAYDYFKKALGALDRLPHEENSRQPELALGHLFLGELYARSGKRGLSAEHLSCAKQIFQDLGMQIQRSTR